MEIKIEGDFSTEKALSWKTELHKFAKTEKEIEIDLTQVTSSDIVGVNALATTYKVCIDNGNKLNLLLRKDNEIYKMLHLTKFLSIIPNRLVIN